MHLAILRKNTFHVFTPIQFIVDYNTQTFCIVNLHNTGSIYMNGWTSFLFTLGPENHEICLINIERQSVCIQPFFYITKFIIDDCG